MSLVSSKQSRHTDVDELTTMQVRRFLGDQTRKADGTRKAPATIAQNTTIVNTFFDWLAGEGIVKRNPTRRNGLRVLERPRLARPEENDRVTTVSTTDVERLLAAADKTGSWNKRLAVYTLACIGPRRRAIAQARLSDYDQVERTLAFTEKGSKRIEKPVPDELADLIDAAINAGVYTSPDDYLIPGNAEQRRPGPRDDRIILRLVQEVAASCGVTTHAHALRAAFAVKFLDDKPGELVALMDLMGHRRPETTMVYLRRRDRRRGMETVRDLRWAPQIAAEPMGPNFATEKEGFEPSLGDKPHDNTAGAQLHRTAPQETLADTLLERVKADATEGVEAEAPRKGTVT